MNKALATFGVATVMVLGGCTTTTPAATVTVTATPTQETSIPQSSDREQFVYLLESVGVSRIITNDPSMVNSLVNIAQTTCDGISDGMTKEDISLALLLAMGETGASDEVNYAGMAAAAAATIVYCPQYQGFWD